MIPRILVVVGALLVIGGVLGLISLLLLPFKIRHETVYDREYDYIRARLDRGVARYVQGEARKLVRDYIMIAMIGALMFFIGFYLGFTAEGDGFWFYEQFYPQEASNQVWDQLNEEGQFVATDGQAYTHYILVSGKEISFGGKKCTDLVDLKKKLSAIRRENTVILIDSFAVASVYHAIEDICIELGIRYEETQ